MAAPIREDRQFYTTVGAAPTGALQGGAIGFSVISSSGDVEEEQRRVAQLVRQQNGALVRFDAPLEPPMVTEFERKLEVLGPDETVLSLVTYLDDAARREGIPFLREWLSEATKVQLSEDLLIAALAVLLPVRSSLPEYDEFLATSREYLRESLGEEEVTTLLRAYE